MTTDLLKLSSRIDPNDMPEHVWDEIPWSYRAIEEHYAGRTAERSGVPLINHIREGVKIMWRIGADHAAMGAYCIHPLFQADADLLRVDAHRFGGHSVMLAMEYRARANAWLSDKVWTQMLPGNEKRTLYSSEPSTGPLHQVRWMLIADKVQNYKDFLIHHKETHPRSAELDFYFKKWLEVLGVPHETFELLSRVNAT